MATSAIAIATVTIDQGWASGFDCPVKADF